MSEQLAIRLRGVVKRYGPITAVNGLDLDVPEAPASGSSARTALESPRPCACSRPRRSQTRGSSRCWGFRLPEQSKAARAQCGVSPQLDNLDTTLTVEQNLLVFTHLYRIPAGTTGVPRSSGLSRWPISSIAATAGSTSSRAGCAGAS